MTSFVLDIDDSFITQKEDTLGKRYYEVVTKRGTSKLPSVSTLVNSFADKSGLQNWQKNLGYQAITAVEKQSLSPKQIEVLAAERGEVAASTVRDTAAKRGTKTHGLCEAYFKHGAISDDPCFQRLLSFMKICDYLSVETKVKWETIVQGKTVGWAGRFDNVANVDLKQLKNELGLPVGNTSVPAIIDYKTWNKPKYNKGQTQDGTTYYPLLTYYLQLTAYLAAFNQCKYSKVLVQDCFLVGATTTCKECWVYHLNIEKVNYLFTVLKEMVFAYNGLGTFSWKDLESAVEPYLGERVYFMESKTKLAF